MHIIIFHNNFRISDNPSLFNATQAAKEAGTPLCCVYIHDMSNLQSQNNAARDWWLQHSIYDLDRHLQHFGGSLNYISTTSFSNELQKLQGLYPDAIFHMDDQYKDEYQGFNAKFYVNNLLNAPERIEKKTGGPFRVFTPYWRHVLQIQDAPVCLGIPDFENLEFESLDADHLSILDLYNPSVKNQPDWAAEFSTFWGKNGETSMEKLANQKLNAFVENLMGYKENRDRPDLPATSMLSPFLALGQINPRQIWHKVHNAAAHDPTIENDAQKFLSEIGWREFSYHLLHHQPEMISTPLNKKFEHFPWRSEDDPSFQDKLEAWQKGQTGYPIVDAAMRQLWQTGWMHNRLRMVVGSFLVKHLRIHWRHGLAWFWDTLVDADHANNTASWQWIAGCGADAAPYFRIFNPMTQGEKFDPNGEFVRKYVPEITALPDKYLNQPWTTPQDILAHHKIILGKTYPKPIVDHKIARQEALDAFSALKEVEISTN